jgi:peptide/nickel transport system ATP-binding protein
VLDLLRDLQRQRGMAMLLISHDLGVVARMADRVAIMYAGELVETGRRDAFFATPRHPYAQRLFAALPDTTGRGRPLETIAGSVPPLTRHFRGCRFVDRCPVALQRCRGEAPAWHAVGDGQQVRCHLFEAGASVTVARAAQGEATPRPAATAEALLEVRELKVHFPVRKGLLKRTVAQVRAVDGVSFALPAGRTLALVGESGCGKTTAGKAILQLIDASGGSVRLAGTEISGLSAAALKPKRALMQMVFQDPYGSLNPRLRVGAIIAEGLQALGVATEKNDVARRVAALLSSVGLDADMAARYPHEFSGGQRQRIAIARALAVDPRLLICDEPTSALDVSVQAQILNLLRELQARLGLAYLFITHNIAVVDYLADQVAVMYLGRIVETGSAAEVLGDPRHPYTAALIAAVPRLDGPAGERVRVGGELPSPVAPPAGCHFHPRCPHVHDRCRREYPGETTLSTTRLVRCHLFG